jgi:phosphoglycerate dehydrogenase-like enzyme
VELTVLIPADQLEHARDAFDAVGTPVALRPYTPGDPFEPQHAEAQVLVPPFLADAQLVQHIAELPKLRLVQLLTVGADAWLGKLPPSVRLSTCRGAHSAATAEWVLMVLTAIYRELPAFLEDGRRGHWNQRRTGGLFGKRVLVVGAGDVGQRIRVRLEASDVSVTMVGRSGRGGAKPVAELPELLPEHDAVVLIVPLTEETRGMVDAAFLAAMPDGSVLVNAARGPVVDTDALVAELSTGRISAALDVTDPEPLPEGHPLWSLPNVLITPHIAGSVVGVFERAYRVVAEQVAAFAQGRDPDNLVRNGY